jgi:hypothetical protein
MDQKASQEKGILPGDEPAFRLPHQSPELGDHGSKGFPVAPSAQGHSLAQSLLQPFEKKGVPGFQGPGE